MNDYHQIVRVCNGCGKTYYKEATTRTKAWNSLNIIMRCHLKKCTGTLNLTEEEQNKIINIELGMHGASNKKTSILIQSYKADDNVITRAKNYSGRRGTIQ